MSLSITSLQTLAWTQLPCAAQEIIMNLNLYGLLSHYHLFSLLKFPLDPILFVMAKCYRTQLDRISRWVAKSAFSDIFEVKKKKKEKKSYRPKRTRWLFKDIDLKAEEDTLSEILFRFIGLFT